MFTLDGDSSDYFDDDLGDLGVDRPSDSTDPDTPPPAKRRRLRAGKDASNADLQSHQKPRAERGDGARTALSSDSFIE
jgi:ATP-dependent DNA helicase MPH1